MQLVIIKPVQNGKAHFVTARRTVKEVNNEGIEKIVLEDKTKYDRFPGTFFSLQIPWSEAKGKFLIPFSPDEVNEYVKKLKFSYIEGKHKGDLITTADAYDRYDAFFNHKRLLVKSQNGVIKLNKDVPKDFFMLSCFEEDKKFAKSSDGILSANVKYLISDSTVDLDNDNLKANAEIDAISALSTLSYDKKVAIGAALNLTIDSNTNPDSIGKIFLNYFKNTILDLEGKTTIEKFLALTKEKPENLTVKHLIAKAKKASVLRLKKGEGYLYNGNLIAVNDKEMEDFLKSPNNADIYLSITEAVKEKE